MKDTKFPLGQVVSTTAALMALEPHGGSEMASQLLKRHAAGDWGDIEDAEDRVANDEALASGGDRILSVYKVASFTIWIITEADRSATTLLLPEDY